MKIYFNNTNIDLPVNDNSYRYRAIIGEHNLSLYFSSAEHVEIHVGAWCEFQGERYELMVPENFKKNNSRNFEYTLIMEAAQSLLLKYKFRDTTSRKLKFSYTARPQEHLQMLVDNLNKRDNGWKVGEYVDAVEQIVTYNHNSCSEALTMIAEAFKTEWEVVGKTIHLRKVEYNKSNPLPLSYGKGNGFRPGVGRSNFDSNKPIEVLYVQGGDRNIDSSKYGSNELLLPKNQALIYEGRTYVSDADGFSIRRVDKTLQTFEEESLDCSQHYPSRVGTVSAIEIKDAVKHFYDFIDNSIPADLDFEKCLIAGESMTVIFQSGMLTGKEFEVKYKHADRRFEIVPQEVDGRTMPDDAFKPVIGDKYAVFGMTLPDVYVCNDATQTGASWDMFREAAKYLYENEDPRFSFTGELDGIWAKKDWVNIGGRIKLGGYVAFSDPQFQQQNVLIRIVGIKDIINNPYSPTIELSNVTTGSTISSSLRKIEQNEVVANNLHKDALQFTKRRYRDSIETMGAIEDAMLNKFTNGISPITVQTMAMLVGDESLQFRFVNNTTNPVEVQHSIGYNAATKVLTSAAGIIQHLTIGIATISPTHAVNEYKFWTLPAFNSPPLTDATKKYYLYAKVSKTANTGTFMLSEDAIELEGIAGYYHLLTGILNSEFDNERSYASLYGYTEVLPGRITTDKIVSTDGKTFFDLAAGEIRGKITFTSGKNAETAVNAAQTAADTAQATANNIQIGGRNYILQSNELLSAVGWPVKNYAVSFQHNLNFAQNKQFTLSFYVKIKNVTTAGEIATAYSFRLDDGSYYDIQTRISLGLGESFDGIVSAVYQTGNKNIVSLDNQGLFNQIQAESIQFGLLKLEEGNKATTWTPAPEDVQSYADAASQAAATAAETTSKAYADGVATAAEMSAINAAQAKANYAEVQAKAYADSIVTVSEQNSINAAKAYADAQDNVHELTMKAYADNVVDAEEARAIADAQAKADAARIAATNAAAIDAQVKANAAQVAAQNYAAAQAAYEREVAKAYADGAVDAEESRAISDAAQKLAEAKADASAKADAAQIAAIQVAAVDATAKVNSIQIGGRNYILQSNELLSAVGWPVKNYAVSFQHNLNFAQNKQFTLSFYVKIKNVTTAGEIATAYSFRLDDGSYYDIQTRISLGLGESFDGIVSAVYQTGNKNIVSLDNQGLFNQIQAESIQFGLLKLEEGNKATTWTPAPEDVQSYADAASQAAATAAETTSKAYADGVATAAEMSAINAAQAKANYAEVQAKAYADSIVTVSEQNSINAAKAYADAQDNVHELTMKAYADNVVDAEEARAIADAQAKADAARIAATNAAAIDASNKATEAVQAAGVDATNKANNAENNAKVHANAVTAVLQNGLGVLAWKSAVEAAQLGTTIIEGGYIKTELIDVSAIRVRGSLATNADISAVQNTATSAQNTATAAQSSIDNLNIGGRNYILQSNELLSAVGWPVKNYAVSFQHNLNFAQNKQFTLSFYVKIKNVTTAGEIATAYSFRLDDGSYYDIQTRISLGLGESFDGIVSAVYQTGNKNIVSLDNQGLFNQIQAESIQFGLLKLEEGNKATTWTPAPEDVSADAQAKADAAQIAAQNYAAAQAAYEREVAKAYADGAVDAEESRAISDAAQKLAEAKADAQNKSDIAQAAAIQVAAVDSTNKANNAISTASVDASNKANNAQQSAQNYAATLTANLQNSLGALAYQSLVQSAQLGETIISGGYIKTELLDVATIIAQNVTAGFINGLKCHFTQGQIGGLLIDGNSLTNEGFNNDARIIMRNDLAGTMVAIGGNVLPPSLGGYRAVGKFVNKEYSPYLTNYGIIVDVANGNGNVAIKALGNIINYEKAISCEAFSNTIYDNIDKGRKFILTASSFISVHLPSRQQIEEHLPVEHCTSDISFDISITMQANSPNNIRVTGVPDGLIIDGNGGIQGGGNGWFDMARGDSAVLRYHDRKWYFISHYH